MNPLIGGFIAVVSVLLFWIWIIWMTRRDAVKGGFAVKK